MIKFLKVIRNLYFVKTPSYVVFFVTSFCNAKCKMCFNWRNIKKAYKKEELKLKEIKKIFGNFSFIQQLTISGGEPFLRKDLPEILAFASNNNDVQVITLPTNGILSIRIVQKTKEILKKIKPQTHLRITLSVEGIGKKHDEIVQIKGAFKKIQKTYRKLIPLLKKHKNFKVNIGICLSSFNKKDFIETLNFCKKHFKKSAILISLARGDTRNKKAKQVTLEDYKNFVSFYNKNVQSENRPFSFFVKSMTRMVRNQVITILKTKKMPVVCQAYNKLIVIQSNGDVFPCEYLNKKLGNLKKFNYDIKKILGLSENKKINRFIKRKSCWCTWECALTNNIACDPKQYPYLLWQIIKDNISYLKF